MQAHYLFSLQLENYETTKDIRLFSHMDSAKKFANAKINVIETRGSKQLMVECWNWFWTDFLIPRIFFDRNVCTILDIG